MLRDPCYSFKRVFQTVKSPGNKGALFPLHLSLLHLPIFLQPSSMLFLWAFRTNFHGDFLPVRVTSASRTHHLSILLGTPFPLRQRLEFKELQIVIQTFTSPFCWAPFSSAQRAVNSEEVADGDSGIVGFFF